MKESSKKYLRRLGHKLKPVIMISDRGITENITTDFEAALEHHELIKVKVRVADRANRDAIIGELCNVSGALLVQRIGNVALVYRKSTENKTIRFPGG